jgi:predicted transposase/invertase (TIGR01784 family)
MKHVLEIVADRMEEKFTRKGESQGKKQMALEIAEKMKAKGKSIDEIIKMTDLTVDDILRL